MSGKIFSTNLTFSWYTAPRPTRTLGMLRSASREKVTFPFSRSNNANGKLTRFGSALRVV